VLRQSGAAKRSENKFNQANSRKPAD